MNQSRSNNGPLPRAAHPVTSRKDLRSVHSSGPRTGGIGAAFLSGDVEDDEDDDEGSEYSHHSPQLDPPARKNSLPSNPAAGRQQALQPPLPLRINTQPRNPQPTQGARPTQQPRPPPSNGNAPSNNIRPSHEYEANRFAQPIPRPPRAAFIPEPAAQQQSGQLAPHPLQAPKTPIAPAFASPAPSSLRRPGVKFSEDALMRGNSEDTLLSRSTPKGAEFWRRFSVVVKEEQDTYNKPGQRSSWLKKNQAGASRMKGCVWLVAIFILLGIGGVATLVYFMTRNNNTPTTPKTLSGAANPSDTFTSASTTSTTTKATTTTPALHTVAGDLPPPVTSTAPLPPPKRSIEVNFAAHDQLRRRHGKARLD